MIKCRKCNVYINSDVNTCPLCKNKLDGENENAENIFPHIVTAKKNGLWKKVLTLVFIAIMVICLLIDFLIAQTLSWSIIVDLIILCVALSLVIGFHQKRNLSGLLFWEYLFVCGISYYWDFMTGNKLWSLKYIVPIISGIFIVLNFILRCVFTKDFVKYFRNIIFSSICVIILAILGGMEILQMNSWISYISGFLGVLAGVGMTIFDGKGVYEELKARFHI